MATLSEFLPRLRRATQVGCAPGTVRQVRQALETTVFEPAQSGAQTGTAAGAGRESIGGVDEACVERMRWVVRALPTGYLVREDVADDRTLATWNAAVDVQLKALGAEGGYLVSDRAKALLQLAEQGWVCLSMPAFLHYRHDVVKRYALAMGQRLRHAPQELMKAQAVMARRQEPSQRDQSNPPAKGLVEVRPAEVRRWAEGHNTS
jgi:hypothetical protein